MNIILAKAVLALFAVFKYFSYFLGYLVVLNITGYNWKLLLAAMVLAVMFSKKTLEK